MIASSFFIVTLVIPLVALLILAACYLKLRGAMQQQAHLLHYFKQAARGKAKAYWLINHKAEILYEDPAFTQAYPLASAAISRGIELAFEALQLPAEIRQKLNITIQNHQPFWQQAELAGGQQSILQYVPLAGPSALSESTPTGILYFRPFIERFVNEAERSARPQNESSSASKTATLFDLELMPLEPFIANSPLAAACLDLSGHVTSSNSSFREITASTKRHAGWQFIDVIAESHKAEVTRRFVQLATEMHELPPLDVALAEGKDRSATLYFSRFEDRQTGNIQILLHIIDTTEQKALEVKYAHSQKMQAVGQLAGGVAHDFNNLLTAMIGFCDLLLQRHPAGDQSFADIMQIKQNANRAANLVRQLLAFSRRQTLQPKRLDLTDVIAELSNLIRRLIGENIDLKVVHGRDIGFVEADQGQLEQVFINLAVNARDAMNGGGMLTLKSSVVQISKASDIGSKLIAPPEDEKMAPGSYVLVEVIDTGSGIPPEVVQKIFEPFYSTKAVGEGTGLGLATVYGIIKQTGGYIFVESEASQGTRFCLYFPRHTGKPQTQQLAEAEAKLDEATPADLTGAGTLMLVEDEEPVRAFASRALRNKGYTVLEASSGEHALEVLAKAETKPQIIISDVIMPGMNGPEMIKKIAPDYPDVKVIFISGYAEDAFSDSFEEGFSFHFLPKPFTLKQLAAKVKEVATS